MNILFVIETGGPGGAEKSFLTSILELVKRGHNCTAVTLREGWLTNKLDEYKISRKLLTVKNSKFKYILELYKIIKENEIDIVHSHLLDSNFYSSIAAFLAGVPHIGTEHGDIHHTDKKNLLSLKTKITSFFTRKIISVSEYSKDSLLKNGLNKNKVIVLGNPFNFSKELKIQNNNISNYLKNDLIKPNDWLWIHVANLRPVKDQITLLKGFAGAKSRSLFKQHLLIAGGGELENYLKEETFKLGISNYVHFLGFRNDIEKLLSFCNGFILSSLSEATPVSIFEAIKYELIVVASNTGGIPELIKHNETGFLFPPMNHQALSETIDYIIQNSEIAKKSAVSANNELSKRFNLEKIINELESTYQELLSVNKH